MSAHTPGPWAWEFHPNHPDKVIALADEQHHHADVLLCTGSGEEAWGVIEKADADLIAAAPNMLSALKSAFKLPRPWIDGGVTWPEWEAAFSAIEAAIAKAEPK